MNYKDIVKCLQKFAPTRYAASWDNVGLLVEPYKCPGPIENLMLTNDLTETVLDEAEEKGVKFILSYHPPVFKALKRITSCHWKERIVSRCIFNSISIYSPHTAFDAFYGGVNDWLISAFGPATISPLNIFRQKPKYSHKVSFPSDFDDSLLMTHPNFENISVDKKLCCITLPQSELAWVIGLIGNVDHHIIKLEDEPLKDIGDGRFATLMLPITLSEVIKRAKKMTGLKVVRCGVAVSHALSTEVKTGAVCAGSGASMLRSLAGKVDVVLSGEMGHHEVLEFTQLGTSVILLEHSNSERGFLAQVLKPKLEELFENKVNVIVSETDKDPLQFL